MKKLAIDVGGSSIKYGVVNENFEVVKPKGTIETGSNYDEFISNIVKLIKKVGLESVACSVPGIANDCGTIDGASALPFIHGPNIIEDIQKEVEIIISLQNDANCAALAEANIGSGKDHKYLSTLVIGSGIGGANTVNGELVLGANKAAGEYGVGLFSPEMNYSDAGAIGAVMKRIPEDDGEKALDLYFSEGKYSEEFDRMFDALAMLSGIVNISVNPTLIVIGGAVSKNDKFIERINSRQKELLSTHGFGAFGVPVVAAKYFNDANLIGASIYFDQVHKNNK